MYVYKYIGELLVQQDFRSWWEVEWREMKLSEYFSRIIKFEHLQMFYYKKIVLLL